MKRALWFVGFFCAVLLFRNLTMVLAAEPDFSKTPTAPKPEKLTVILHEPIEQKAALEVSKLFEQQFGIKVEVNAIPWANPHEKITVDPTSRTGTYDVIFIPGLWSLKFIYAIYIEPLKKYWNTLISHVSTLKITPKAL